MDSLAAFLGESQVKFPVVQSFMPRYVSFGLLHRIPPQSVDRTPGAGPIELQDQYEENGNDLFIPADVRGREQPIPHYSDQHLDGSRHSSRVVHSDGVLEQNGGS